MPSHTETLRSCSRHLCIMAVLLFAFSMSDAYAAEGAPPNEAEIEAAIEKVKADPNLGTERKTRVLKWAGEEEKRKKDVGAWQAWLKNLFGWIGSTGRVVFWLAIALLVALLAVFLARYARNYESRPRRARVEAPTHVRELDIRPESLPADIGEAAMQLWSAGQHREALALLYRGLLSRLVHVHSVAIRQSSTEAECLDLSRPHLREQQIEYMSGLLHVWQRAVYGGKDPVTEEMQALCSSFASTLGNSTAAAERA